MTRFPISRFLPATPFSLPGFGTLAPALVLSLTALLSLAALAAAASDSGSPPAAAGATALAPAPNAPQPGIEGGRSADGRYELRLSSGASNKISRLEVGLFDTQAGTEAGRIPLVQPRLPDPDAPPCQAIWHPGGTFFALLDHDHKYSTRLSIYTLFQGRPVRLTVPDYIQNALGRVDATETALPCWSRAGLWNGDDLSVILIFNAPDREGKWIMHNAVVTLRLVSRQGKLPEVKLAEVRIVEKTGDTAPPLPSP